MIIGVAGPYSAETEEEKKANLDAMNIAAANLLEIGHIPLIGMNAALPVIEKSNLNKSDIYDSVMKISLAVIDNCDGILILGDSPGVRKEMDLILSKGLPVYYKIEDIPNQK